MAVREARPVPPCTRPYQPHAAASRAAHPVLPLPALSGPCLPRSFPGLISLLWSPSAYVCLRTLPRLGFSMSIPVSLFCASPTLSVFYYISCAGQRSSHLPLQAPHPPRASRISLFPPAGPLGFLTIHTGFGPASSPTRLQPRVYLIPISI